MQDNIRITKIFKFETGHALNGYDGLCKNIHGHSYKLSDTVIGKPIEDLKLPNSDEPGSGILVKLRAASITAICIPKHIPRKGILFSLAYFIDNIFPSEPLSPNPPGTNIPCIFSKIALNLFSSSSSDESILWTLTFVLFAMPPWVGASSSDF